MYLDKLYMFWMPTQTNEKFFISHFLPTMFIVLTHAHQTSLNISFRNLYDIHPARFGRVFFFYEI